MEPNKQALLVLLVAALTFEGAHGIKCFDCTSVNNSMCLDPTVYDEETLQKYLPSVECHAGLFTAATHEDFFCRKIVQAVLHKNHDSEVRVTRGCGYVRHRKDCYKADNEDHLETVCQCFKDDCNGAATLRNVGVAATVLTAAAVLGLSFKL
ncbi:unnamed protein product [Plutella xylostella]|uniref:(diamondback moth) hypothetical protein n=1 Tax=Plutella xylostella TaxID=51655 RepID=A0A8S4FR59_PLUXY|nr:unnamed protein product [Plutella xylostella]